ncbi:MAG: hypothetical protein AB8B83_05545 [Bdellovibrionales bacterium]
MNKFKIAFLSFVTLLTITALPALSLAQSADLSRPSLKTFDRSYRANPYFDHAVRNAMLYMDNQFNFANLRKLYSETSQYDPIGENVINQMQKLAFTVQTGKTTQERAKAIDEYRNLVMMHMGNIRVVAQALSFTKLDKSFGRQRFFMWMRDGLVRSIMAVGDGNSINSAFYVFTMSEETVILGQLGFKVLETIQADQETLFYNMHDVEDIRTGQKKTLFINTTQPMMFLRTRQAEEDSVSDFEILRQ